MIPESISLSVVVPVYNEGDNIAALHHEIVAVCEAGFAGAPIDYEIIIVNDGSTDDTAQVCRSLHPLTYVELAVNRGQTAALDCGFRLAKGDYVAALDGDGQNDPADIPALIRYLLENRLDAVSGWRKDRRDPFGKCLASRGAAMLRKAVLHDPIHDSGCTLKVYRKECLQGLDLLGEQHRFIPAILTRRGFSVGEMPVHHRPRQKGKSKYGPGRIVRGFLDLLLEWYRSRYADRPMQLWGKCSLGCLILCLICAAVMVIRLFQPEGGAAEWGIPACLFLVAGGVFFGIGILCETLSAMSFQNGRKAYRIVSCEVYDKDGRKTGAAGDTAEMGEER